MSYRFMRVVIFFDLPTLTALERKTYRKFRQFLIKEGFIMMQESVYSKLALNGEQSKAVRKRVTKECPKAGLVQMLTITEKQYAGMEMLVGEGQSKILETDSRVTFL